MKLTLGLQREMSILVKGNNLEIEILDDCSRDLWKAQIQYWLEDNDKKVIETGFLRVENNNKLKLSVTKKWYYI